MFNSHKLLLITNKLEYYTPWREIGRKQLNNVKPQKKSWRRGEGGKDIVDIKKLKLYQQQ